MDKSIRSIRWITFFALLAVAVLFLFPLVHWTITTALGGAVLVLIAAGLLTWALESWLRFLLGQLGNNPSGNGTRPVEMVNPEPGQLLLGMRALLTARSKPEVVNIIMQAGVSLLMADGASFVGFEEWGSPQQPITYGVVPHLDIDQWQERLINPAFRQACQSCELRESGIDCPLNDANKRVAKVVCQPLTDESREIGVLNFFFISPKIVADDRRKALACLAENAALTLRVIRTREAETMAYRNLQLPPTELIPSNFFTQLGNRIKQELGLRSVFLVVEADVYDCQPGPKFYFDDENSPENGISKAEFFHVLRIHGPDHRDSFKHEFFPGGDPAREKYLLVYPATYQNEKPVAWIVLVGEQPVEINCQRNTMLQIIIEEIALLITAERSMKRLEFKAVGDERIRLAREIHDGLAQTLAYLKFQSAQMLTFLSTGNVDRLEAAIKANYQTLSDAYQDARLAIDNLRSIPGGDTQTWLLRQASSFSEVTGILVDVSHLNVPAEIPLQTQTQLIRIVQEALSNIQKHAQASKVALSGSLHNEEIVIEIADNGSGFEPDQVATGSKYGLVGMRERTELVGGEFQIISRLGEGTTVRITIPIHGRVSWKPQFSGRNDEEI
jgi:signal transduction histidine kinase